MIVRRVGYLKIEDVLKLSNFSIYKTNKNTNILVLNTTASTIRLYYPKEDRLPWKTVEGKKICHGKKIFDNNDIGNIDLSGWNNTNQIMSYEEFIP